MLLCVVFAYSHFIDNPPHMILGDKPLILEVVLSQLVIRVILRLNTH
jgi:hypothetical protein